MWHNAVLSTPRERGVHLHRPNELARMLLAALALMLCLAGPAKAQTTTQYSNTTTGGISDLSCNQPTTSQIVRTFTVPGSFIVGDVNLGVFLTHSYRSDLRIFLTSPAGTTVTVMTWTGNVQSGDNLNDVFDDEAAAAITSHDPVATDPVTPVPPDYFHSFRPSAPLSAFDGQNAAGVWSLRICDAVSVDIGNFARADLYLTSTSTSVTKSSTVISDGVSGANPKALPGAVVSYCILVTNNGTSATAASTNVVINDPLPANSSYVAGTLRSGPTCASATTVEDDDNIGTDESDPFGASISGSTISGSASSLAAGGTFAIVFRVTIN
jgi:uncharacterized repeat protein (TIGR01451 family)